MVSLFFSHYSQYLLPNENQHDNCEVLLAPRGSDISPLRSLSPWLETMRRRAANKWKSDSNELQASSEPPHLTAGMTENLTHLRLTPRATTKICGISKQSSALLVTSSPSEQGLDWMFSSCVLLAAHHQTHSLSPVVSCCSLCFWLHFWCEIAFLLLQTAASSLIREGAQSILPVKWRRG